MGTCYNRISFLDESADQLFHGGSKSTHMTLKIVHLNREIVNQEKAAKEFWEKVLKPKRDARDKARAEKLFARLKADPALLDPNKKQPKKK
jgi:hypothetical protein